jgi:nicotinamide-nucleotide amidase
MFPPALLLLAKTVLDTAREKKLRLATAESCTGGLIAGALTEIPGSSDVFERGFVVYSNHAKQELLDVPKSLLAEFGAVSEEVAIVMATGAVIRSRADVSVAVTGIAGPGGGTGDKPVGLVHIAAYRKGNGVTHEEYNFGDVGRSQVRLRTIEAALMLLREQL